MKRFTISILALLAIVVFSSMAYAQGSSRTGAFDVVSQVGNFCDAPITPAVINLGIYDPLAIGVTAFGTGGINVTCVRGLEVQISLNAGLHPGLGGVGCAINERAMEAPGGLGEPASFLCYTINYVDASNDPTATKLAGTPSVWAAGEFVFGTGQGGSATYNMLIEAPPGQTDAVFSAAYRDTVGVTIVF